MKKKQIKVVAALVFDIDGNLLIAKRPKGSHLAGMWEFPGGKVDYPENVQQALVRELREELAVEITVGELFFRGTFEYDIKIVDISFYFCSLSPLSGTPRALEVEAFCWVKPQQLRSFEFPPADEKLIRKLLKYHQEQDGI